MSVQMESLATVTNSADTNDERRHSALRVASMAAFFAKPVDALDGEPPADPQADRSASSALKHSASMTQPLPCSCGQKPRFGAKFCHSCGRGLRVPSPKLSSTLNGSSQVSTKLPPGVFHGRGTWRGAPQLPRADASPDLKRSQTASEWMPSARILGTGVYARANSTPAIPVMRRKAPSPPQFRFSNAATPAVAKKLKPPPGTIGHCSSCLYCSYTRGCAAQLAAAWAVRVIQPRWRQSRPQDVLQLQLAQRLTHEHRPPAPLRCPDFQRLSGA